MPLTDNSILLPSNKEALKILREESKTITEINTEVLPPDIINELCITVWEGGWYLGCVMEINDGTVLVDHLERTQKTVICCIIIQRQQQINSTFNLNKFYPANLLVIGITVT